VLFGREKRKNIYFKLGKEKKKKKGSEKEKKKKKKKKARVQNINPKYFGFPKLVY